MTSAGYQLEQINWGCSTENTRKRFRSDDEENAVKKGKYEFVHPLIYTIGKEIHFSADINKITIEMVIKQISKLIEKFYKDHDDNESYTVTYVVDTPGGSVNSVLKFVDYIKLVKSKYPNLQFVSIISGLVASAGTVMCVVADKRYMTRNAHAMIHELSSGNMGRYTQLVSYTDFLKELHDCLLNIYLEKTKKNKSDLELLLKNDTWYNADEYLNGGFVDEIK
jgi:ATP-dependent protease ClpP protease subunit